MLGVMVVCSCSSRSSTSGSQSYSEGIALICDAPSAITSTGAGEVAEAAREVAEHIEAKLKNREAIETYSASGQSIEILAEEARKAGLESCAYVEWMKTNAL